MAINIGDMTLGASASGALDVYKQIETNVLNIAIETVNQFQSKLEGPISDAWNGPDAERWLQNGVILASNIATAIEEKKNQIATTLDKVYEDWREFQENNVQSF